MNEKITALLTRIAESDELQAKFAALGTPEEAYELAKSLQDGFTKEEFLDAVREIAAVQDEDISDEELASVAGGIDTDRDCRPTTDNISRSKITPGQSNKSAVPLPQSVIRTTQKLSNV